MTTLKRASNQLFERSPDERFGSLAELREHCGREKRFSTDHWLPPQTLRPQASGGEVTVSLNADGVHRLSDWSFSQLCRLAGVSKERRPRGYEPRRATHRNLSPHSCLRILVRVCALSIA